MGLLEFAERQWRREREQEQNLIEPRYIGRCREALRRILPDAPEYELQRRTIELSDPAWFDHFAMGVIYTIEGLEEVVVVFEEDDDAIVMRAVARCGRCGRDVVVDPPFARAAELCAGAPVR